ncbi:histidinol dehydrogenase [Natranaerobius trueperi]|uniref:Histidinol dehydrogenase n=1 Tax=Natranaerobius trueperi TaxID=759412 RepID=A0A226BWI1_9FIRM|nr:histidinol dehydrogenase [Natranaerobius trueperi]OWZ83325.1 histidinol dehydrogenase [Natranaerobius trueperi]
MYKYKEAKHNNYQFDLDDNTNEIVKDIIAKVKLEGDNTLLEFVKRFDQVKIDNIYVSKKERKQVYEAMPKKLKEALLFARNQIEFFANKQLSLYQNLESENIPGVTLGHRIIPVSSCGCYVPAGRYPLPSSALMSIVPAKVAGVERVVAVAPPSRDYDSIHPVVLAAMYIAGADEVYISGGAQAIAALAYGTETINKVDMIVGPGNRYVTEAKRQVNGIVGIDQLAGPSEVLIIADDSADIKKVATDLLAQAEHDPDAKCILVTTNESIAKYVEIELKKTITSIDTFDTANDSWSNYGEIIIVESLDEAIKISDEVAPEHLQLLTKYNDQLMNRVKHFGSLFVGEWSSVAFGDYVSGTNHILPTGCSARFNSGLTVGTFLKTSSFQKISKEGAKSLAYHCSDLADLEGLDAHKKSSNLRID